ncbi:MAG: two-component regulator propeller domain-containing protein [Chitinophagaceae bacterium]
MKKLILISFFLNTMLCINAQQKQLSLNALTVQNGLPDNNPRTFVQDSKGYIWIGTAYGLVRYDGYNVKIYNLTVNEKDNEYHMINCLFVDHEGILWVEAGNDGFFRYNRKTDDFTQFRNDDKTSTRSSIYIDFLIKEDKQGKLWLLKHTIADIYYLDQFNPKTGTFLNFSTSTKGTNTIPVNKIFGLIIDQAGRPWISTDNGIYVFDTASNKFKGYLTSSDTASYRAFVPIYEAPSQPGILWMNIGNAKTNKFQGLLRFDMKNGDIQQYKHDAANIYSIADNGIGSIMEDKEQRLWIGTGNGLSLFDRKTERFTNYITKDSSKNLFENTIYSIQEDRQGFLWMKSGNGLLLFNPQKELFTLFTSDKQNPEGLPDNPIREIFIDKTYNIWLAFANRYGLQRINQEQLRFTQYKNIPGNLGSYTGGRTTRFVLAKDGTYWLASLTGLYNWNQVKDQFRKIDLHQNPSENDERINDILLAKNGILWGIINYRNIFCYNPATGNVKYYNNINIGNTIYEDKYGFIWASSQLGGMEKLDSKTGKFMQISLSKKTETSSENFLKQDYVTSMYEDRKGVLWVGTNLGSLNRLDNTSQTFIPVYKEKNENRIWDIYEDSKNNFWLTTVSGGLVLFDRTNGNIKRFAEKDGLQYDAFNKITEDKNGFLWIASERGLSRMDTKNFTFSNFTTKQGLPEGIINSTPFLTNSGELLIGTSLGFFSFSPGAITPNPVPPFINIETINYSDSRAGKDLKEDTLIIDNQDIQDLPYNKNRITFYYTGVHFTNSALNQYAYKLEGYDNNWVQAGVQRSVTYNNLGPGTYTFMVKSANSDGIWNDTPASFTIIIHPPWWKTWWAYTFFAFLFVTGIWAFINYRSRSLIKEKRVLENKVTERTAQVLHQKEEIQNNLNELKSTQSQLIQSEKMASLGELTAGIAHEIQNPLNFVNNFSEVSKELLEEMKTELNNGNTEDAKEIADDVIQNLEKINHHGKRADAIVKGMLQHSQSSTGKKEPIDINALCDEYLRLSYHGLRAKDKSFNADFKTDFDNSIGKINIVPQDIGRVLLNLFNNAFYAVNEKLKDQIRQPKTEDGLYVPTVQIVTQKLNDKIEICVSDNGNGIPQNILDKIFQPFFTTKPTGQETGLGLSLSYDIIKAHGGEMKVESRQKVGTTFIIQLPVA